MRVYRKFTKNTYNYPYHPLFDFKHVFPSRCEGERESVMADKGQENFCGVVNDDGCFVYEDCFDFEIAEYMRARGALFAARNLLKVVRILDDIGGNTFGSKRRFDRTMSAKTEIEKILEEVLLYAEPRSVRENRKKVEEVCKKENPGD